MPPNIALIGCIIFILSVLIMDSRRQSGLSRALWIPLIWFMVIGSRPISLWLNLSPARIMDSSETFSTGSPVDRNFYLILIVSGLFILSRRKISWQKVLQDNKNIFIFFLYIGISILWSDYPFVSFKRYIKEIGNLIMILIVLTENDSMEAIIEIFKKCAYVLIPLSITFIKYYSYLGRAYHQHTGELIVLGVTTNKNSLGILCFVCFIVLFWDFCTILPHKNISHYKKKIFVCILFLLMTSWLLIRSNSATSLMCAFIGTFLIIGSRTSYARNNVRYFGIYSFIFILVFIFLQLSFDPMKLIIKTLGRDMTLTGRTDVWKQLIDIGTNPIIGTGYESFWLGERTSKFQEIWHLNQAHNGYLETYLNLGYIGLFLLIGVIVSTFKKCNSELISNYDRGMFRIIFLIISLFYNFTEASFKGLSWVWIIFIFIAFETPQKANASYPRWQKKMFKVYSQETQNNFQ